MFASASGAMRLAALLVSLAATPVVALELARPDGPVLLQVAGDIGATNAGDAAVFDLAMLRALPRTSFTTSTIWTAGPQTFTGVLLKDLVDALAIEGDTLLATAINDYTIEIPLADAVEGGPILAYERNGAPMSLRDKGPIWLVYPYDSSADYRTEVIYARSVWQLHRLTARN